MLTFNQFGFNQSQYRLSFAHSIFSSSRLCIRKRLSFPSRIYTKLKFRRTNSIEIFSRDLFRNASEVAFCHFLDSFDSHVRKLNCLTRCCFSVTPIFYYYYSLSRGAVCSPVNVLFDDNGQSLKLGEIKLEKSQVCLVPAVKKYQQLSQ